MENFVLWIYSLIPSAADYLPPVLLYLGLWVIVIVVVAVIGWLVLFLIGSVLARIYVRAVLLFLGSIRFLTDLVFGKSDIPDQVHPVIQRVVVVHGRGCRDENEPGV